MLGQGERNDRRMESSAPSKRYINLVKRAEVL